MTRPAFVAALLLLIPSLALADAQSEPAAEPAPAPSPAPATEPAPATGDEPRYSPPGVIVAPTPSAPVAPPTSTPPPPLIPTTPGAPVDYTIGGEPLPFTERPIAHWESPQRFALEIKLTPYTPHIDESKGLVKGATPFADLFNNQDPKMVAPYPCPTKANPNQTCSYVSGNKGKQPPYRLLTAVEFDYQFLHKPFGNFGFGLTTGFYRRTTHSFELNQDGSACTVPYCVRSGDQTGLNIIPLSALFIYRFDYLAKRFHIPLVPYAKIGVAYYIWWINDGGGIVSIASYPRPTADMKVTNPSSGYGGTFGFVLHPGIALQLDFLERGVAKTMDTELGINHTYIFCELNYANITGFGASHQLDLSDTMVNSGLGFEF